MGHHTQPTALHRIAIITNMAKQDTRKLNVGILGATGTVGQRFIVLLSTHPNFIIHTLGASARSAGQAYVKATKWKQSVPVPQAVREVVVNECKSKDFEGCDLVFSGLDHDVAGPIELEFAEADIPVFTNAKNYRREPSVPLVVPLVNSSHFDIIPYQRSSANPLFTKELHKGFILANANCSTTGIVVPLKALEQAFGPLDCVLVNTMQAISGAGYPGVSSIDIHDNVVPYIGGEEEKIEWETSKILGGLAKDGKTFDLHTDSPLRISASCNRVNVLDGHTEVVSCSFKNRPAPTPEQAIAAMRAYKCEAQEKGCPSAPEHAIFVHDEQDRPQPRLDRYFQDGAGVNVGRVRSCGVLDLKFVVLSNNVSIGAATSSIMNAELAMSKGLV